MEDTNLVYVPVSVIIPCYCCADTIGRAVGSIAAQTRLPQQVFLVDDHSPDEGKTLRTLNEIKDHHKNRLNVIVLSLTHNQGPSAARNTAWNQASHHYVAFLDADDSWHPRKIEIQFNWMENNPEIKLTSHQTVCLDSKQSFPDLPADWKTKPISAMQQLVSNRFPTRTVMVRRDVPLRFEPSKRRSEDYLLWLNFVLRGHTASHLTLSLAASYKPNYGDSGLSEDLWQMELAELDTYRRLYQEKLISAPAWVSLICWSLAKHVQRTLINATRQAIRRAS